MCNSKKTHEKCPKDRSIMNERETVAITFYDGVLDYQFQCSNLCFWSNISTPENTLSYCCCIIFESNNPCLFKLTQAYYCTTVVGCSAVLHYCTVIAVITGAYCFL
jgi:hypothetical protein